MISKNIYCSGFKETLTSAHYSYLLQQPMQHSFNSDLASINLYTFFDYLGIFLREGAFFFFFLQYHITFPALMLKYVVSQGAIVISYEQIIIALKFCALVKTE